MRVSKLFFLLIFLSLSLWVRAAEQPNEAATLLPHNIGAATAQGPAQVPPKSARGMWDTGVDAIAFRSYLTADGQRFIVGVITTESDADAFAHLTTVGLTTGVKRSAEVEKLDGVGTAAFALPGRIYFYKGKIGVTVTSPHPDAGDNEQLVDFARQFAETLDKGTGEIPPLVEHLPDWRKTQEHAVYAVNLPLLQAMLNQPVLDAVSFEGGTEAVTAPYEQGQLLIIEFTTPQLAADNDARIGQRIAELRGQNQPVPSAYRRVGNYAVFVFDAPSAQAANGLIDQVKYEKVVQWLGEDPHRFERANRFWLNMSGSIIVNTIKATALAILLCLGIGGLFGSIIFARRRAQAALSEQYTDAGGMMRLNLDDLAAQPARLLPPGGDD